MDSRTLTAYGLAVLLGLAVAAGLAYFRYNSVRQKHQRSRVHDRKRSKALRAGKAEAESADEP